MTGTEQYRVGDDATIDEVDLDDEVVITGGRRLTNDRAEEIADGVLRRAGRPSLSGRAERSPQVTTRLSPELDAELRARAEREHKKPSQVIREALVAYLD